MKPVLLLTCLIGLIAAPKFGNAQTPASSWQDYIEAKAPLRQNPYIELPLGAIKPQGWLRQMLIKQKEGATGNLDKLYPLVMGNRNGWLGGDGDQWERGPYWIDGLLPLAYILQDKELIAKVKPWIEWSIKSQQPDGYFGPSKDYSYEPGIQRDNSRDWWPKMVMLKVLKQYYQATNDKRVITLLINYFKYQLNELPKNHLNHWTFWAEWRGGDNLMVVYWLYNITDDKFLLNLANIIHQQTFDFTGAFLKGDMLTRLGSAHGVNLAEGMKEPLIYYQQHPEEQYINAMKKGLHDLTKYNGMAHGLFGADESLHGNNPTQGSELCTAVEMMFTLENSLSITGDVDYADRLEKIAFNALPSQTTEDYMTRQYFQQANQVMLTRAAHNFNVNHAGTDICYGLLSGYPCCTSNMHQGWPKFTQNLWYATADKGVAALVYSASEVNTKVGNGTPVTFKEETNYPFDETIRFTLSLDKKTKSVAFPFHLRIPAWCNNATIKVNGVEQQQSKGNQIVKINREWKSGDVVELQLPMHIYKNTWYENSVSVERGPLVYALKIGEETRLVKNDRDPIAYGSEYMEVRPTTPWNYGLIDVHRNQFESSFTVKKQEAVKAYPWSVANAPIQLTVMARRIPNWTLYNDMTGPMPFSVTYNEGTPKEKDEEVTLVPYGCTKLRISQFPVVAK